MERYGLTTEGSMSDPSPEWTAQGPETGLEEPMWQLGLGGPESYPERPDEADCIYYLRTGFCGYGSRCRFNHPRDRGVVIGAARPGGGEYPERVGQPVCQYYMRTGTCKFGASCKYHHPRQGGESTPVSLNYFGYPLRQGEKECSYYVKTGQCKFGGTCKFHHPQPAGIQVPPLSLAPPVAAMPTQALHPGVQSSSVPSSQQYGVVVARPPLLSGSYVQSPYGPVLLPSMVPFPGWNSYPVPISPVPSPSSQASVGSGPLYGMTPLYPAASTYTGTYQPLTSSVGPPGSSQKEYSFPERPGQQECPHYMRTGDCKFGSSCRYHHPPELVAPKRNVVLNLIGLPLRPGAPPCTHYAQRGVCKFGPACKFDHPTGTLSYSPSASSLADMPVAPYPVGSSIGTLAPSSSSSELRPEHISGSSKDSVSSRMSSSTSTSSGSIGSTFSKSEPIHHLTVQQSAHGSGPSTGGSSGGTGFLSSN
ncbi:zinc finger CCCH domain-containing protein 34-like [Juglans microcarpa x Juglans regia]|uniref:zinc finger CCCH domain-containing protein 34-like n=1 Tax=Juglans microcarpa x Juglans regia TaxID=2249226 RepID=UPI001B7F1346|nr:zinc finger CCCH domain-containing protein 34-like [Juglans microcarpa x Juglans regia]